MFLWDEVRLFKINKLIADFFLYYKSTVESE